MHCYSYSAHDYCSYPAYITTIIQRSYPPYIIYSYPAHLSSLYCSYPAINVLAIWHLLSQLLLYYHSIQHILSWQFSIYCNSCLVYLFSIHLSKFLTHITIVIRQILSKLLSIVYDSYQIN